MDNLLHKVINTLKETKKRKLPSMKKEKVKKTKLDVPKNPKKVRKGPKKTATKVITIESLLEKLKNAKGLYWALDPGVASPALFRIEPQKKSLKAYYYKKKESNPKIFFSQKIDDNRSCFFQWDFEVVCLDEDHSNDGSFARTNRMIAKIKPMIDIINQYSEIQTIAIEDYAYQAGSSRFAKKAKNSASTSILCENGGILRMMLSQNNHQIVEVPISTNKKQYCGNGHAKKSDMEQSWLQKFYMPDLKIILKKKKKVYTKVPSGCDDICDAHALCVGLLYSMN